MSRIAFKHAIAASFGVVLFCAATVHSQTLNLPPRPLGALSGGAFATSTIPLSVTARENTVFAEISSGNIPDFLRTLVPVTTNAVINGSNQTITYYVTADYLAVGSDDDYFLQPMSPLLGQRLANLLGCSMPTRKMVNDIWTKAPVKLNPVTFSPATYNILSVDVFIMENNALRTHRNGKTNQFPLGALTGGCKKDVVISSLIYNSLQAQAPKPVVIYGWHQTNGSAIQPLYNGHEETYADYSHGVRLVQMDVMVNGVSQRLTNVLTNPNLAALVSDETLFTSNTIPVPRYTVPLVGPVITTQPISRTVDPGANVTFSVVAVTPPALTYQWKFNGANIAGATNTSFSLTNVQSTNAGSFTVVVSDGTSSTTTIPAILRVNSTRFPALFRDDFETNSSANWNLFWGSGNNVADYTVDWSYDYGTNVYTFNGQGFFIPPAPNSVNGTTRGLKLTVNNNDANSWITGVNMYPKNKYFGGNFVLKCDMWLNYPGGAGGSGTGVVGSTEHAIFGINHFGTNANWAATNTSSTDGIWFGVDGEGGTSADYRAYVGNVGGPQTQLTNTLTSGMASFDNASGIYPALFSATRFETLGSPGKNWVAVEIIQTNNNILWKLDGTTAAQRTNSSVFTSGNIMLGLMDTFPSIANPAKDSFVLFDNVRVEPLSDLRFGASVQLPNGSVQLSLLGAPGENYFIESSTNLLNWSAFATLPGSNGPSAFVIDPIDSAGKFFRANRSSSP